MLRGQATGPAIRNPRRRSRATALTPLIDVVFILLLFFMLATSLGDWRALEIIPAGRGASAPAEPAARVLVRLRAASLELSGRAVSGGEFTAALQRLHAGRPGLAIVLDVDPDVPLQRLVDVLQALGGAGLPAPVLRNPPPSGVNR